MKRLTPLSVVFLAFVVAAIAARFLLLLNYDREAGSSCIRLKLRPSLEWLRYSSDDLARDDTVDLSCDTICDDGWELGDDLVRWNARIGWWYLPLTFGPLAWLTRRRGRSTGRRSPA
jgi:hypothetical protein